ncbi:hypothetical protein WMY93_011151 [Mugilogobius chulae]|uniref:Uncharacterized protein n=1 Tax=Mugilogobius chulae TaxID=88201 RepID=A0AAW0P355_9GOBI
MQSDSPNIDCEWPSDELIVGSNLLRYVISGLKKELQGQKTAVHSCGSDTERRLLSLMAGVEIEDVPDVIGTVKTRKAVTLEPMTEHLVWAKLQHVDRQFAGSEVLIEPTNAKSRPRTVIVGRSVAIMREDGWLPLKVINPSHKHVTIKRNAKLADVSFCESVEEFCNSQSVSQKMQFHNDCETVPSLVSDTSTLPDYPQVKPQFTETSSPQSKLSELGLSDVDIESCEVSPEYKAKLTELVVKYQSIFSRDKLDCGKAVGYLHRIRVTDEKPFKLPCRRIPPTQYEKLREVLDDMVERDIIRKSSSEYASPLVIVSKKTGDLRICNDFRWLNARTVKDAHPLPHPADALSALGESLALERLEMVFQRLQSHNLKLAPKKCNFLRRSVKFLGHIISADGIQSDPDKVAAITSLTESDLMEDGTNVPSQCKVRSFLGMVVYYQQFIEGCSAIAKPLFKLTSGPKGPRGAGRKRKIQKKLNADDWTDECRMNRTLGNMIRALPPRAKHRWPDALKSLTFAYNCTVHETTGFAPFLLMFGRVPRLPVDVMFGSVLNDPEVVDYDRYVASLRKDMRDAMAVAQSMAAKQLNATLTCTTERCVVLLWKWMIVCS